MMDEAKAVIALGFFASATYVVRLFVLHVAAARPRTRELPAISEERFTRLEQAVDAISLEVERIAEGQRFTTKLLTERASAERAPVASSQPPRQITPH